MRTKKLISLSLLILLITSCKINTHYDVTGVILDKNTSERILKIDHDRIEGFMEPMIMDLNVHKKVNMDKINIMDSVKFSLVITEDSHYTTKFDKLGIRNSIDDDDWMNEDSIYSPKEVGEKFSDFTFTKTDNTTYSLYDSKKDFIIISYIFSRCPIPNMCPAVITKNQFLADAFKNNENIEFLLVSFDFIHDTPSTLSSMYNAIESNNQNIIFLSSTNHYNDLISLTKQSNVSFGGVEENNIGHTMRTIILDKNKKLLKFYDGINWKPSVFKRDLLNLINLNK